MPKRVHFVEAVVKATGEAQTIPAHWLDNPVLAAGFESPKSTRKPSASSAEVPAEAKSTKKEN